MEECGNSASNGSHVALCQQLLSLLFHIRLMIKVDRTQVNNRRRQNSNSKYQRLQQTTTKL